ncbi:acyl-CoA dehydrogenase family protein [Rhodococcus sp. MEB064]|uniref:acyl-CoA dehydrogenase family protein n=1 Tax=Rhodococcus sp. MEB064 TaxID=1587522 RepID=UPI0005AC8F75|nr:acyl-CoA dehydrogenase family protein [Rhodococcus sp. MEB064]KIQ14163.1 hydroxylase [Rhodococcus sp. MEB064]
MHEVLERVEKLADSFEADAENSDALGKLTDETASNLREAGVIRLLQPIEYGGFEAHPADFLDTVMKVGSCSGSAGWVSGVVGVHPWELALLDSAAQDEIWGQDPDTWVSSPYAPFGRARRVDGGYIFNGRWPFSTGTDHSKWIIVGGFLTDASGEVTMPPRLRHFLLPISDYVIEEGSWDVVGLKGSGSKDVTVKDAFVPDYHVLDPEDFADGRLARERGRDNPMYSIPFLVMFSGAIAAGTLGIAEGALAAFIGYTRDRIGASGNKVAQDPFQLASLGAAVADVNAGRLQLITDISRMYDDIAAGGRITEEQRITARINQVRSARRAVDAIDMLFAQAGGNSLRLSNPLQRFWRDMHASMNHVCNVAEPVYQAYGHNKFGQPIAPSVIY